MHVGKYKLLWQLTPTRTPSAQEFCRGHSVIAQQVCYPERKSRAELLLVTETRGVLSAFICTLIAIETTQVLEGLLHHLHQPPQMVTTSLWRFDEATDCDR